MELALRRTLMWVLGGVAVAALVMALLVTVLAVQSAAVWLSLALGLALVAVAGEVVLLFWGERGERTPAKPGRAPAVHLGPSAPVAAPAAPAPAPAGKSLVLRCSSCTRTFTALDDGHRPLATLCPHCGQRGVIDAPAA